MSLTTKTKKYLWMGAGFLFLGIAYIGVLVPGIPWSAPCLIAAYCFAKGSERWHKWLYNHKIFGPFLTNWGEKRVFPTKAKWAMVLTMDSSLIILWFTTHNWKLVAGVGFFMLLCAIWALKYPSTIEEWQRRVNEGRKVGWLK